MAIHEMTNERYQLVYNAFSFTLAFMAVSTIFFFLRVPSVTEKFKPALITSGLVVFIATYHYFRIFNSWVEAYAYPYSADNVVQDPVPTGVPFNDAYRYMDWLLTVPLLLIEIILVQKLTPEEASSKSSSLGFAAALMIVLGYPGELIQDSLHIQTRWVWWALAMVPFVYIVFSLTFSLRGATEAEEDTRVKALIHRAHRLTIVSWCLYPVVYVFPMIGIEGPAAVVAVQVGYCVADIVAKCGVGFVIYRITVEKSKLESLASKDGRGL